MLNFVYWPISAVMWLWHKLLGYVFGEASGVSWVLSIVLLVVTIRILLFRPMLKQQRSMIKMQKLQPKMQEIKRKYPNDQQAQARAMREVQKEMGVNPLAGCLPILVQMPVFIGLFHVLRCFNRTGDSAGGLGMTVEQNLSTANYAFSPEQVRSFLEARFFGAPLAASMSMGTDQYGAFSFDGAEVNRIDIIIVAVPLIAISAIVMHLNARWTISRQERRKAAGLQAEAEGPMAQQADMMNKMMLWVFPIMIIATGAVWSIGLLVYTVTNNIWTVAQSRYIFSVIDREEREEAEAEAEARRIAQERLAPKPGVKPVNPKKGGRRAQRPQPKKDAAPENAAPEDAAQPASAPGGRADAPATPRPGQRPGGRKKSRRQRKSGGGR